MTNFWQNLHLLCVILCVALSSPNLYRFLLLVTCHCFSPLGQRDTQETEISSSPCTEAGTAEVTAEDHGLMSSEESNKTLSVESLDVITLFYDTVDQGSDRYCENM